MQGAPLRQFGELATFSEWLAPTSATPSPPRFHFGVMPAAVAGEYFRQRILPPVGLYAARDITIDAGPWLYHDNEALSAPELGLRRRRGDQAPPATGRKLDGPHALIAGRGYEIYGHWLAEILPKLGVLHAAGLNLDAIRLLLPHDTPAFALEMLRLLGFEEARFVRFGGPYGSVTVGEFFASSFLHNGVRYAASLAPTVRLLRERVERRFGRLARGEYPARLCVARRGDNRACVNRAWIERRCAEAGLRIVAPETLPLLEQWRLFADAREIIGEYGSALHGAIFSPPGTLVCGLRGAGLHPSFIQSGIGEQLLQPTGYVFGVNEGDDRGPFRIEPGDFEACLESVFASPCLPMAAPAPALAQAPLNSVKDFLAAHDEYLQAGQWEEAHRALRNALRRDAKAAGAQARLARLLDQRQAPGALAAIDAAIAAGETTAANLALRARLLMRAGSDEEALLAAADALRLAPEDVLTWRQFAEAALRTGRNDLAIEAARRAVAMAPEDARCGLLLVEALTALSPSAEATALIEALYRKSPRKAEVAYAYARLLLERGEASRALPVALAGLMEAAAHPGLSALASGLLGGLAAPPPEARDEDADEALDRAFVIDFTAAGNSAAHRVSGWSAQEDERVWAIGASSALILPPLDANLDWSLEIDLDPLTHPPALPAQGLTVRFGAAVLLETRLTEPQLVRLFLPQQLLAARPLPPLVLEHPDYASPRDLGLNNDARPLAVSLRFIRLAPSYIRSADNPGGKNLPPTA